MALLVIGRIEEALRLLWYDSLRSTFVFLQAVCSSAEEIEPENRDVVSCTKMFESIVKASQKKHGFSEINEQTFPYIQEQLMEIAREPDAQLERTLRMEQLPTTFDQEERDKRFQEFFLDREEEPDDIFDDPKIKQVLKSKTRSERRSEKVDEIMKESEVDLDSAHKKFAAFLEDMSDDDKDFLNDEDLQELQFSDADEDLLDSEFNLDQLETERKRRTEGRLDDDDDDDDDDPFDMEPLDDSQLDAYENMIAEMELEDKQKEENALSEDSLARHNFNRELEEIKQDEEHRSSLKAVYNDPVLANFDLESVDVGKLDPSVKENIAKSIKKTRK